jgi:hypothetical protein
MVQGELMVDCSCAAEDARVDKAAWRQSSRRSGGGGRRGWKDMAAVEEAACAQHLQATVDVD